MSEEYTLTPLRGREQYLLLEDLRMETSDKQLVGFTVDLVKSLLAELILRFSNEEEFLAALKDKSVLKGKSWKEYLKTVIEDPTMKMKEELSNALDDKYKEAVSGKTNDMKYEEIEKLVLPYKQVLRQFFSDPNNKALCQTKAPEPHAWLNAKGKVEVGTVGATAELPGFFVPIDKGRVEFLAQKSYLHEYWYHGDVLNGKFVFRKLARTKKWQKAGRERQVWMLWRTKDGDLPYVLKKRAVDTGWMPPKGKSALPEHIRKQIPEGYEYWLAKDPRKVRDSLVKAIRKKEVVLKPIREMLEKTEKFQLKRLWWKGPTVIRGQPQIFYVLIFHNDIVHGAWYFTETPVYELMQKHDLEGMTVEDFCKTYCKDVVQGLFEQAQAVPLDEKDYKDNKLIQAEGQFPPKHPLNPNKELPLYFDTVDKGQATLISEEKDRFYRYELNGEKIKGLYVLIRQSPSSKMWYFKKAELPKPKEQWVKPVIIDQGLDRDSCLAAGGKWVDGECVFAGKEEVKEHYVGKSQFVLHRHHGGGLQEHWDIRILADNELLEFNIYKNPMEMGKDEPALAVRKYCDDLSWFIVDGRDVTKIVGDTMTRIDVLDKGKAEVLSNDDKQATFIVEGEHLQGYFQWDKGAGTLTRLSTSVEPKMQEGYAPVPPSGKMLGSIIQPSQIADSFSEPIKLQENFVFMSNPERKTLGDIDIFIKAPMLVEEEDNYEQMSREQLVDRIKYYKQQASLFDDWYNRAIRFRLEKAVQAKHPEVLNRLDIRNDFRGPFTTYLPLYDLELVPSKNPVIQMSREEVEKQIQESFRWARKYEIDRELTLKRGMGLWIRGEALYPRCSLNKRYYSREEIAKMARTAIGKPICVNHNEPPYQGLIIGRVEDAEEEGGRLEFIGVITDKEWMGKVKQMKPEERKLSIGANPREIVVKQGREYPEGLVIDEISILVPPAEPGMPKASFDVLDDGWR